MILSTILKPPGAPEAQGSARDRRPVSSLPYRERARRNRQIGAVALISSLLLHGLVVLFSPLFVRYLLPEAIFTRPPREFTPASEGTRIVELLLTETPRVQPQPEPEPPEPEPEIRARVGDLGDDVPLLSPAERLRPRVGDWRLWVMPPLARRELTPAEREADINFRLRSILAAINDSLAAEEAALAARNDWTVGEEGNKWGVSPGKLHLGPITLPFPISFGPSREDAAKAAEWQAIQQQAGKAGVDEVFDSRVKAIRERKAQEEAKKKAEKDSTSNR